LEEATVKADVVRIPYHHNLFDNVYFETSNTDVKRMHYIPFLHDRKRIVFAVWNNILTLNTTSTRL
jgi:hypothetical protein